MEKLEKTYIFRLAIYGYRVEVIVSKDILQSMKSRNIGYDPDSSASHVKIPNEAVSLIFLPIDCDLNSIAHESTHISQSIVEWIGAGYKDREFIAYLFAHVTQGVYEFHQKAKKFLETH